MKELVAHRDLMPADLSNDLDGDDLRILPPIERGSQNLRDDQASSYERRGSGEIDRFERRRPARPSRRNVSARSSAKGNGLTSWRANWHSSGRNSAQLGPAPRGWAGLNALPCPRRCQRRHPQLLRPQVPSRFMLLTRMLPRERFVQLRRRLCRAPLRRPPQGDIRRSRRPTSCSSAERRC